MRLVRSISSEPHTTRYELQPVQITRKTDNEDCDGLSEVVGVASPNHQFKTVPASRVSIAAVGRKLCDIECSNRFTVLSEGGTTEECPTMLEGIAPEANARKDKNGRMRRNDQELCAGVHANDDDSGLRTDTGTRVVQGNMSQSDSCFQHLNSKTLSLSNVLMSLIYLKKETHFKASDVNFALLEGARLCDKAPAKINPNRVEEAISKLLSQTDGMYNVAEVQTYDGVFSSGMKTRNQKRSHVNDMLLKAFASSTTLILTLGQYMLSVLKSHDGTYVIFNPNPCNATGLPTLDGQAALVLCKTVEQVYEVLNNVSKHIKKKVASCQIVAVTIVEIAKKKRTYQMVRFSMHLPHLMTNLSQNVKNKKQETI